MKSAHGEDFMYHVMNFHTSPNLLRLIWTGAFVSDHKMCSDAWTIVEGKEILTGSYIMEDNIITV